VLAVERGSGAPIEGATVELDGTAGTTAADGSADLGAVPAPAGTPLLLVRDGGRGVALLDAPLTGDVRVELPNATPPADPPETAGFTARVLSTGDEIGPVGTGIALPSLARAREASLLSLLGEPYVGTLELPLLGAVGVPLPASTTLSAEVPLSGAQTVRETAYAVTAAGRRSVTAFEGRSETGDVFAFFGGVDPIELALDLAQRAEGMDALWQPVGALSAFPLVEDGDLADDVADVDGDGDLAELVPDYASMPAVEVSPSQLALERVGLSTGALPADARTRAFAVAGLSLPGYGFVPTAMGALAPGEAGVGSQLKATSPDNDALTSARRDVVVEAIFDDGRQSRLSHADDAFGADWQLGDFLIPPDGAFFLDGVPTPTDRLLVLPPAPGATTYRIEVTDGARSWALVVSAADGTGRSVAVPASLGGIAAGLGRVEVLRAPGASADAATLAPFTASGSFEGSLDDVAGAWAATAP
jgi:hypothetical protein